jgi:hypothetical protein
MAVAIINARDHGVIGNGITDDTQAINNALAAVSAQGGTVILPDSNYKVTGPLTISRHGTRIVGAGDKATQISFAPSSAAVCFDFVKTGELLSNCAIRNLKIVGSGSAQKIGIRAVDTTRMHIEHVVMSGMTGNTSIGIQLKGREFTHVGWVEIYADRPMSIEDNPNNTIDCDMAHFQDLALVALEPTESCVYIAPNINLTNLVMSGTNSMAQGVHGIYWPTSESGPTSLSLRLSNIRREQSDDEDGYAVYIDHYTHIAILENIKADSSARGFYLRNTRFVDIRDCMYDGTPQTVTTPECLNIDETCARVRMVNFFCQLGSTRSIGNLETKHADDIDDLVQFSSDETLGRVVT